MEAKPKRKIIRLKEFDYTTPKPYFITICAKDKECLFTNERLNQLIIECLLEEKEKTGFKIFVYCLVPNHLHLLLAPSTQEISVSQFIGAFKSKTARRAWDFDISGTLWQRRFYDRIIRREEDLKTIGQYTLDNPVRKGIVSKWQDYKFLGLVDSWV
ncbi:MAG: transposase [Candidatus Saganbacteria bacterium]|uniref:Transposase n=1 Tax=Candidatus Saganbacteria bacterium TaxID=2575572 RepID=A0A833NY92_UNCSA|nr:MAG: transposase [Candidatus Saganbacteria bacterium]